MARLDAEHCGDRHFPAWGHRPVVPAAGDADTVLGLSGFIRERQVQRAGLISYLVQVNDIMLRYSLGLA